MILFRILKTIEKQAIGCQEIFQNSPWIFKMYLDYKIKVHLVEKL